VEEILVDVREHAGRSLEGMVSCLEPGLFGARLVGGMAGQDGRDVEDDRGFFEGERVLRGGLVGERIVPVASGLG
jgi:hypothetical protein